MIQVTEGEERKRTRMNKVDENGGLLTPCSEKERGRFVFVMLVYKAVWLVLGQWMDRRRERRRIYE